MKIEDQLQLLLDEREISRLLTNLVVAEDKRDWEAYGNAFVPDAVLRVSGGEIVGREAIKANPAGAFALFKSVMHYSCNHTIIVNGDEATASHYLFTVHVPVDSNLSVHWDMGGRQDCRCVRTKDGWRVAEMNVAVEWMAGEIPAPIRAKLIASAPPQVRGSLDGLFGSASR